MSIVTLVSGGLDSTVMSLLAKQEGLDQFPLFIDYGQLNRDREFEACRANFHKHSLPEPEIASIPGYGELLSSGLTHASKRVREDAFLPGRNFMFLTVAAGYAHQVRADAVSIGLLDHTQSLFPDQTPEFLQAAETAISTALGHRIRLVAPLISLTKGQVVEIAKSLEISNTYSCHAGGAEPCGECIACREYLGLQE